MDELIKIQDKIKQIINSNNLNRIPTQYLPKAIEDNYFFISYSHKDYKSVYVDLLYLQANNLHFWYDINMAAGTNWELMASRFMAPFQCKGVIFYVSENSLKSISFIKELEYAKKFNKPIITINLPFESDYVYKGESVKGKTYTAKQMILILQENGVDIPEFEESKTKIEEYFPEDDKVIYLKVDDEPTRKINQIQSKLKEIPLLEFDNNGGVVTKLNDHNLLEIKKQDILGEQDSDLTISKNLFSNCLHLKKIDFGNRNMHYDSFAFAKCTSLIRINNTSLPAAFIEEGAFYECSKLVEFERDNRCILNGPLAFKGCESLESITINCLSKEIPEESFSGCTNLTSVQFLEEKLLLNINKRAFYNAKSLKSITIPDNVISLKEEAFAECKELSQVKLPANLLEIEDGAFKNCLSLVNISIPNSIKRIGAGAFDGCTNLQYNEYDDCLYLGNENNPYLVLIKVIDNEEDISYLSIHENCVVIADGAFENYPNTIETVKIPPKVITIGKGAFKNCTYLVSLYIGGFTFLGEKGKMLKINIEEEAFYNCPYLASVLFDFTSVSKIGNRAFNNCKELETFIISAGITEIGYQVFDGCDKLKKITYKGSPSMFSKIEIAKNNDKLFTTNLVFEPDDVFEVFGRRLPLYLAIIVAPTFIAAFLMMFFGLFYKKTLSYFWHSVLVYGGIGTFILTMVVFLIGLFMTIVYKTRKKRWIKSYNKYKKDMGY